MSEEVTEILMGGGQSVLYKKDRREMGSVQELQWPKAEINL